jgi:sugar/nucleoside kinase (ribokinase family)
MIVSLGDLMVDAYFQIPDRRNPRTDTQGRVELAAGGSAANFAVWIARHGRKSGLIGRVGHDFLGRALVADLEHEGVCPYLVFDPDPDYGTGRVGVIVAADGERDMVCDRRANARLSVEDIPEHVVAGAEWLHVSGYVFLEEAPAKAARHSIDIACEAGVPVSVDPAAYSFIHALGRQAFLKLCDGATVILPNLDEGRAMTGLEQPEDIASCLLDHFPVVALKLGADGCLGMARQWAGMAGITGAAGSMGAGAGVAAGAGAAGRADAAGRAGGVDAGGHVLEKGLVAAVGFAAVPTRVVDTTGAGDAFDAGFVLEYSRGAGLAASLARGNEMGARVVSRMGAR